jgi:GH24 family phage-related lysozyme (muramidase)
MFTMPDMANDELAKYERLKETIFSELNVGMIGIVTGFSNDTGLPTVKPVNKQRIVDAKGNIAWLEYPEIPDVLCAVSKPTQGSAVLLVFCDDDTSTVISATGTDTTGAPVTQVPQMLSKHSMSHAVAIPLWGVSAPANKTSTGVTSSATASSSPVLTTAGVTASQSDAGGGYSMALVQWLEGWEGLPDYALNWYNDGWNNMTIGYGHVNQSETLPTGYTAPLTRATAESLLMDYDLPRYVALAVAAFPGKAFTQNQKDAMTAMCYALGDISVAARGLVNAVNEGLTGEAMATMFGNYANAPNPVTGKLEPVSDLVWRFNCCWQMYEAGLYITREGAVISS